MKLSFPVNNLFLHVILLWGLVKEHDVAVEYNLLSLCGRLLISACKDYLGHSSDI
jgi:hypothetical protein